MGFSYFFNHFHKLLLFFLIGFILDFSYFLSDLDSLFRVKKQLFFQNRNLLFPFFLGQVILLIKIFEVLDRIILVFMCNIILLVFYNLFLFFIVSQCFKYLDNFLLVYWTFMKNTFAYKFLGNFINFGILVSFLFGDNSFNIIIMIQGINSHFQIQIVNKFSRIHVTII